MPSRVPKYGLHKPSGQAVVYINRAPVYLGKHGTPSSYERYDAAIRRWGEARGAQGPQLRKRNTTLPSLRQRQSDGRAVVTFEGKDVYCGRAGTPESEEAYARLTAAYVGNDRSLDWVDVESLRDAPQVRGITVTELIAKFLKQAFVDYPNSNEATNFVYALKPVKRLFGSQPAVSFGPLKLKLARDEMIRQGWKRKNINKQVNRVRRAFRWAVSEELLPASVVTALGTVAGLRRGGRSDVVESDPVLPVRTEIVQATLPHVSEQVRAIIEILDLTGARAGEVVALRVRDIDTMNDVWRVMPLHHKNAHREQQRVIHFGPRAKAILAPFLQGRDPDAYIFSAAEAEAERRRKQRAARKSPVQPSQVRRAADSAKRGRKIPIGAHYTVNSLRKAIVRGCEKAFNMPKELRPLGSDSATVAERKRTERSDWHRRHTWHPHQLRHTNATRVTKTHGIEAARAVLGQATVDTTALYAAADDKQAAAVMAQVG